MEVVRQDMIALCKAKIKHHQVWCVNFMGLAIVNFLFPYFGSRSNFWLDSISMVTVGICLTRSVGQLIESFDSKDFLERLVTKEILFGDMPDKFGDS